MDPLTITTSVLAITARCLTSVRALNHLKQRYKDAPRTISTICSEATIISSSLSHLQSLLLRDSELRARSELESTFDTALTGCAIVFSVLDDELQKLSPDPNEGEISWTTRIRHIWKEDTMADLLQQIRGQQGALSLLIQVVQMESLARISTVLQDRQAVLHQAQDSALSLRKSHPTVRMPRALSEFTVNDRSSFCSDLSSNYTTFDFDQFILTSPVYRRVYATSIAKSTDVALDDGSDDDATITPKASPEGMSPTKGEIETREATIIRLTQELKTSNDNLQLCQRAYQQLKQEHDGARAEIAKLNAELEQFRPAPYVFSPVDLETPISYFPPAASESGGALEKSDTLWSMTAPS